MHANLEYNAYERSSDDVEPARPPESVHLLLRTTHSWSTLIQSRRAYDISRAVPWPGQTPISSPTAGFSLAQSQHEPQHLLWSSRDSSPPILPKHPARLNLMRDLHGSKRLSLLESPPPLSTLRPRIISRENIRA